MSTRSMDRKTMSSLHGRVADIRSYHYLRFPELTDYRDTIVMHRHCYAAAFSVAKRMSQWVAYCVTLRNLLGSVVLSRNFHADIENAMSVRDFRNSDFDMGHLCPLSSYRSHDQAGETNSTVNIVPQTAELNRGPWLAVESRVRELSQDFHDVWVVAIPMWVEPYGRVADVDVPSHFAKVIAWYDRLGHLHHACYIMPQGAGRKDDPNDYLTTLPRVVELSGIEPIGGLQNLTERIKRPQ